MIKKQNILQHPRNSSIKFDKEAHTYVYQDSIIFDGVTKWLSNFGEPFNQKEVAKGYARKNNRTVEDVLLQWEIDRSYGDYVHDTVEYHINEEKEFNSIELKRVLGALRLHRLVPIASEWIIYDETIKRASGIDIVCLNENGEIVIVDLKTMKNGLRYGEKKKMSYPLNNLWDNTFYKYSLQVSVYRHWLEKFYNVPVAKEHYILHIRPDSAELIKALDLRKEIINIYKFENE